MKPMHTKKPMMSSGGCAGPSCKGCSGPNCYADGGSVHEKGINKQDAHRSYGTSEAGHYAKYQTSSGNSDGSKDWTNSKAKEQHHKTIGEMRSMPKPKLQGLAHGGRVGKSGSEILSEVEPSQPGSHKDDGAWMKNAKKLPTDKEVAEGFSKQSRLRSQEREADRMKRGGKYADGGKVAGEMHISDEPEMDEGDSELHDMMGKELMSALEKKDSKAIMSAIEACVLSCMNKSGDEE